MQSHLTECPCMRSWPYLLYKNMLWMLGRVIYTSQSLVKQLQASSTVYKENFQLKSSALVYIPVNNCYASKTA